MKTKMLFVTILFGILIAFAACGSKVNDTEHGNSGSTPTARPSATPGSAPSADGEVTKAPVNPTGSAAGETPQTTATPSASDSGKKYVVVLDPGHGGIWRGAESGAYVESELNLRIANYCRKYLEAYYPQIEVYMTRTDEKTMSDDLATDLKMRVEYAKNLNADILVSIHLNSFDGKNSGCMVCTQHRPVVKENSAKLAGCFLDELEKLGLNSLSMTAGVRKGIYYRYSSTTKDESGNPVEYYAICRHSANMELVGVIVEHCFIDNKNDQAYLDSDKDLMALGVADGKAIAAYFGLEKDY